MIGAGHVTLAERPEGFWPSCAALAVLRGIIFLRDPRDDMVLEMAVAAGCEAVVTHNRKDFRGIEQFGLEVLTPQELLKGIGELR